MLCLSGFELYSRWVPLRATFLFCLFLSMFFPFILFFPLTCFRLFSLLSLLASRDFCDNVFLVDLHNIDAWISGTYMYIKKYCFRAEDILYVTLALACTSLKVRPVVVQKP